METTVIFYLLVIILCMFKIMTLIKFLIVFNVICLCTTKMFWKGKLTSKKLEENFKKNCKAFGVLPRTKLMYVEDAFNTVNCGVLWQSFYVASTRKDPCAVTISDYAPFIRKANSFIKEDPKTKKPLEIFRDKVRAQFFI